MRKRKYEVPVSQELIEQYANGKIRLWELANILKVSRSNAFIALVRAGYVPQRRGAHKRFKEVPPELMERYQNGELSRGDIAELMNCSRSTVEQLMAVVPKITGKFVKTVKIRRMNVREKARRVQIVNEVLTDGKPVSEVLKKYNISKQRVYQILNMEAPERRLSNGMYVMKCSLCPNEVGVSRGRSGVICSDCVKKLKEQETLQNDDRLPSLS